MAGRDDEEGDQRIGELAQRDGREWRPWAPLEGVRSDPREARLCLGFGQPAGGVAAEPHHGGRCQGMGRRQP